MALMDLPSEERVSCLIDLLSCVGRHYIWQYDIDGNLLETNCPDRVLDKIFAAGGCQDILQQHFREHTEPAVLSNPYGLNWSAVIDRTGDHSARIYVLGPVCYTELSNELLSRAIQSTKIPHDWRPTLIQILRRIPELFSLDFFRYTLMLHYCVSGQRLTNADLCFHEARTDPVPGREKGPSPVRSRMNTYLTEQALMRMISEGDMNYKSVLQSAADISHGVPTTGMGSLEQAKVSQIVFISLCTRAAIRGGVSPEIAYSRGDAYIQDVMDSRTVADTAHIGHSMYEDFIQLVRKERINPALSPQIQSCCDYIELHAEDEISLAEIAGFAGYAEYYLSRKFKSETGYSVKNYIKFVKIERAKTLLQATDLTIQEICDRLHFGSRGFFSETFREIVGTPPAAYREQIFTEQN